MSRHVTLVIQTALYTHNKEGVLADFLGPLPDMVQEAFGDEDVVIMITSAKALSDDLTPEQIELIGQDILNHPDFPVRTQNCLRNARLDFLAVVPFLTEKELRAIKSFGKKSIDSLQQYLKEKGLTGINAQQKIDRYITKRFEVDHATLKKLRTRLSLLEFTETEAAILTACGMRTLAGAVCWDEEEIFEELKTCHRAHWVWGKTFDPNELMERLRRVVQEQGFTFGNPELQKLRPWIAM